MFDLRTKNTVAYVSPNWSGFGLPWPAWPYRSCGDLGRYGVLPLASQNKTTPAASPSLQ